MCIVCVDCLYLSKAPLLYPSIVFGCGVEADLILCVEASPQCQKKSYKELIIRVKTATTKQQMLRTKTCCKSRFDVVVDLLTCEH